jgi:hypothetical protein
VRHKFRTFGLERVVRNRRALMDTAHMNTVFVFARDEHTNRHSG